jgi:hypothetical protein
MIKEEMKNNGNECSLNHIDISQVINMNYLFSGPILVDFNGDISGWDTSNVERMAGMFSNSKFNNDSICDWDVSNVENMETMFFESEFNSNISSWDVSNVYNMMGMFFRSNFNQDISNWEIRLDCNTDEMFTGCPIENNYRPKCLQ